MSTNIIVPIGGELVAIPEAEVFGVYEMLGEHLAEKINKDVPIGENEDKKYSYDLKEEEK